MLKNIDIKISNQMLSIISEIDEFKGFWKLFSKITYEKLKALKKAATIESIGSSSRIGGNKLSDEQIEELLFRDINLPFVNRDEEEVIGYAKLTDIIFEDWKNIWLSENYIKKFHKILFEYSSIDEKYKGKYKKISNDFLAYDGEGIELGIVVETASPFETSLKMEELVEWTSKNLSDKFYHPLIVIGIFVVNFLKIYPFRDGNGRLSRALTDFLLLKSGYEYIPYSSTEAIIEDTKEIYYKALRQTQTSLNDLNPDYEPWLMFFLKTLLKQKIRLEYRIEQASNFIQPNLNLPEISAKIMEVFEIKDRATISELSKLTGMNINTIKKHLSSLVKNNYLIKHGKTRGAWYTKTRYHNTSI